MNYCPKCGNKINDGDKFCSNCGYKVEVVIERNDDYYSNNYIKNRVSNTPSGASKTAFILSITTSTLYPQLLQNLSPSFILFPHFGQ